jgi:hypothetical protein
MVIALVMPLAKQLHPCRWSQFMSKIKYLLPVLVLSGTSMLIVSTSYAKPEFVKTTKKACVFCHVDSKAKPKELTDAGKYYKEHNNSLDGYKAAK